MEVLVGVEDATGRWGLALQPAAVDSAAPGGEPRRAPAPQVGFARTVVSAIEMPNLLVNLA